MGNIIVPGKKKESKSITGTFEFNFTFREDESFETIIKRLDETMLKERNRAVEAVAKFKGAKVNFE